jgi:hypothetical protein
MQDSEEAGRHPVLFIDNCDDKRDVMRSMDVARDLVQSTDFTYTTTIRCDFILGELPAKDVLLAADRCAVWTHHLLENRLLIVSTEAGLKQMQVQEIRSPGHMWRNSRLGVILCIPPLLRIPPGAIVSYQSKIERVLREKVTS